MGISMNDKYIVHLLPFSSLLFFILPLSSVAQHSIETGQGGGTNHEIEPGLVYFALSHLSLLCSGAN